MQRLMSVLLVVVAACGGDSGTGDDSQIADASFPSDSAASSDAPSAPGLQLVWNASPLVPGSVSTNVTVTSAKFFIKKLEVIGDAGAPLETTRENFNVLWNASSQPFSIPFDNAPPAIYSKVRIALDKGSSNAPSVEIMGTTVIGGTTEMFRISSEMKLDLEVTGYNVTLFVGSSATMTVDVELDTALANVDWQALPVMNNARQLGDGNNAAMGALFDDLEDAFTNPDS